MYNECFAVINGLPGSQTTIVSWQCFDDFVKKQRGTREGVTLTIETRIDLMFSSLSSPSLKITGEICYADITTVKRIIEYLSNYLKQESMEISIELF